MLVVLCTEIILFHMGFAFLHQVENAKKFDYFHDCCSDFSLNANCFKGQNKDSCQVKTKTTSFLLQTLSIVRSKWCHKELLLQKLWTKLHILLSSVTLLEHLVVSVCVSVPLLSVCVSVSLLELVVPLVEVDVENNDRASRQASHQESRGRKSIFWLFPN